jgi:AraC-like DNA-binding protein
MMQLLSFYAEQLEQCANRWMTGKHPDVPSCVARAMDFVRAHVGEEVRMREVAHYVHLAPCYFCRLFTKATGIPFVQYVARFRVEKAKELLRDPAVRVSEAAFASGFQSLPYFNRVFKRCTGLTPTAYRAAQRG